MIITIDGPTASGKSTVAHMLAKRLSLWYLNTGFIYRALAYILVTHYGCTEGRLYHVTVDDLDTILSPGRLEYSYTSDNGTHIFFKNEDITRFLKQANIDMWASIISAQPDVRYKVMKFQQILGNKHSLVAEGRDCGTVVFPLADYKFFLTGSIEVRSKRWQQAQQKHGMNFTFEQAMAMVQERDNRDTLRTISPLVQAPNAKVIDTTSLDIEQLLTRIISLINMN